VEWIYACTVGSAPVVKPQSEDSPEVAALRKKARGEALSAAEETILARTYRKPPADDGPGVPHEEIMRRLAERKSRGE
jgi:hypothetical protein